MKFLLLISYQGLKTRAKYSKGNACILCIIISKY